MPLAPPNRAHALHRRVTRIPEAQRGRAADGKELQYYAVGAIDEPKRPLGGDRLRLQGEREDIRSVLAESLIEQVDTGWLRPAAAIESSPSYKAPAWRCGQKPV